MLININALRNSEGPHLRRSATNYHIPFHTCGFTFRESHRVSQRIVIGFESAQLVLVEIRKNNHRRIFHSLEWNGKCRSICKETLITVLSTVNVYYVESVVLFCCCCG